VLGQHEVRAYLLCVVQTLGIADIPLKGAEFMTTPRKIVQLETPIFKPSVHGHLLKLSKVSAAQSHVLASTSQ
jgi:hypothetical protein